MTKLIKEYTMNKDENYNNTILKMVGIIKELE